MPLPLTPPPVPVSPARPPAHDFVISYSSLVLGAQIGGGGFGSVYKADYHGTPVAVKLLHNAAQSSQSDSIISEFRSEVAILSRLRHPNICLFMGADFTPPNRCIVTELATRGSLWDGLRTPLSPPHAECDGVSWNAWPHTQSVNNGGGAPPRGTWPFALVKSVCVGTVRGMLYLHGYGGAVGSGILHRDLKVSSEARASEAKRGRADGEGNLRGAKRDRFETIGLKRPAQNALFALKLSVCERYTLWTAALALNERIKPSTSDSNTATCERFALPSLTNICAYC